MANMQQHKTPMPEQAPAVRAKNFDEVACGYTESDARNEAARCLQCKHKPCVKGCPVGVDIPGFIAKIAEGDDAGAIACIKQTNALPAVCGRVCPQESQCERLCVRGIKGEPVAIGRLERYAADTAMAADTTPVVEQPTPNGRRVAVVGAGPAGLTCAGTLAAQGFDVTIFEALHKPGGVLVYGIPEFRLPKAIVQREIDALIAVGVKLETNCVVGRTVSIDELFDEGFEAVFIGSGAGLPNFMKIPGEQLNGVFSANEFLTRVNLMKAYEDTSRTPLHRGRRVCVVGGGNVAMDAARSALRLGADSVTIVYRRTEAELPARLEEVHHAHEEGVQFHFLTSPTAVLGDDKGWVTGLQCEQMELGEPDASGRRRPVRVENSAFTIDCDSVIMAIGTSPNRLISETTPGLDTNKWGCLVTVNEQGLTTKQNVYAGGDAVTGAATVILAMGAGREAAKALAED